MGMVQNRQPSGEMVQGTLDMLILRTLVTGPAHGHTIANVIEHGSENVLEVEQGSLYPALHRLEDRGWVSSYWGASENNRRARFYKLTPSGKKQLNTQTIRWRSLVSAIGRVLGEA
jgi:PadR family transcriptional regulator, regulatory protein PadR